MLCAPSARARQTGGMQHSAGHGIGTNTLAVGFSCQPVSTALCLYYQVTVLAQRLNFFVIIFGQTPLLRASPRVSSSAQSTEMAWPWRGGARRLPVCYFQGRKKSRHQREGNLQYGTNRAIAAKVPCSRHWPWPVFGSIATAKMEDERNEGLDWNDVGG